MEKVVIFGEKKKTPHLSAIPLSHAIRGLSWIAHFSTCGNLLFPSRYINKKKPLSIEFPQQYLILFAYHSLVVSHELVELMAAGQIPLLIRPRGSPAFSLGIYIVSFLFFSHFKSHKHELICLTKSKLFIQMKNLTYNLLYNICIHIVYYSIVV